MARGMIAAGLAIAFGCGPDPSHVGDLPSDDDLREWAERMCAGFARCEDCADADPDCVTDFFAGLKAGRDAVERGELEFDAGCLDDTTWAFETVSCQGSGFVGEQEVCQAGYCRPFHGSADEGAPCTFEQGFSSPCEAGLICTDLGVCGPPCGTIAAPGGACSGELPGPPSRICPEGYRCGSDDVCVERLTAGGSCSFDVACAEDLYCADGACTPRIPLGSACDSTQTCAQGLVCPADGVCSATCDG